MISDLVLSVFAISFFLINWRNSKFWSLFFLFMGLSAAIGSLYHGEILKSEIFRFLSWALLALSLISAQFAAFEGVSSKWPRALFLVKSPILLALSIYYVNFNFMVIDTAISLFGFVVLGNLLYLKSLSKWISYGISVSILSVFFIINKVVIDPDYLSYNDIGHYISIISLMIISKGVYDDGRKKVVEIK
jgi:hypothetical protein